ncbi:MAG: hypothetical protein ACR2L5_03810 [Candidatus Actinomarinaceae bacterium]
MGSESATKSRETKRAATSQELMENIRTGGEISKKREAELAAAADYGRGIKLVESTGSRKGAKRIDPATGRAIGLSNASDYTGKITASTPTFGELAGDAKRVIFGGAAPSYSEGRINSAPGTTTTNYMEDIPKPREQKGIIPAAAEGMGKGGMIGMAMNAVLGREQVKKKRSLQEKYDTGVEKYSTLLGGKAKKGGLIR